MSSVMDELFKMVPEDGIVVRDDADGFHARFTPLPPISYPRMGGALAAWGVVCAVVAYVAGDRWELQRLIWGGSMAFGTLMYMFNLGRSFMPVEIAASHGVLYIDGDRRPLTLVRGATLEGIDLVIRASDGSVIAQIHGVTRAVGGWLVEAIDTMVVAAHGGAE